MDQPASTVSDLENIRTRINQANLPSEIEEKLIGNLNRLEKTARLSVYSVEHDRTVEYINFVISLPFNRSSQDILDLRRAAQVLEKNHYGLKVVKDRILEYLSVLILNYRHSERLKTPILGFVGLVGSGKTSLAYSIAESLGRQLIRIPFGGLGSVRELRGESRIKAEAEPGQILRSIDKTGVNNPIILLDEIDRIAPDARSEVMGVLVELLDPEQNYSFVDYYLDYPFDLSKVLFIATANNTGNIATAVMDRLEVIEMPSYSDEEKIVIGRDYILPKVVAESGLRSGMLQLDSLLWPRIIRPLGFDGGIRSLQKTIQAVVRKVARQVVEGQTGPFVINEENIGEYIN